MAEFTNAVIEETAALNSHLTSSQLKERITMDPNDPTRIKDVDFFLLGIKALPEFFGHLKIIGDLNLFGNKLTSLPESMGSIQVGGNLHFNNNALTSLPESMGLMQVDGDLYLHYNPLPDPKPTWRISGRLVDGSMRTSRYSTCEAQPRYPHQAPRVARTPCNFKTPRAASRPGRGIVLSGGAVEVVDSVFLIEHEHHVFAPQARGDFLIRGVDLHVEVEAPPGPDDVKVARDELDNADR